MQRQMKLKGRVRLEADGSFRFLGEMYDSTPFELPVGEHDIELNESFRHDRLVVDGWLFVLQEAKQDARCYLTLPKPTIQFGKQIVVHEYQLSPFGLKIEDFKPKKQEKKKAASKITEDVVKSVVVKEDTDHEITVCNSNRC